MTIQKTIPALASGVLVLTLAACGGEDQESYATAESIRDALAGTEYECSRWDDQSETNDGSKDYWDCQTEAGWLARIGIIEDEDAWTDLRGSKPGDAWWAIRVDDWSVDCYAQPHEECRGLEEALGGEHLVV